MTAKTAAGRSERLTPGARRILDVASELFCWRGVHAVGVDTIDAESGVTKRTFYDRFGSKDGLVVAYLEARDRRWRDLITARLDTEHADAAARVLVPFDVLPEWLTPHGRGCSFVNAFAELPDPEHPAGRLVVAEKKWLRDLFRELLAEAGARDPDGLAVQLLSLHEGAIVCHAIADEPHATATARAAAETLLAEHLTVRRRPRLAAVRSPMPLPGAELEACLTRAVVPGFIDRSTDPPQNAQPEGKRNGPQAHHQHRA